MSDSVMLHYAILYYVILGRRAGGLLRRAGGVGAGLRVPRREARGRHGHQKAAVVS